MKDSTFIIMGLLCALVGAAMLYSGRRRRSNEFNGGPLLLKAMGTPLTFYGTLGLLFGLINGRMSAISDALTLFGIHI